MTDRILQQKKKVYLFAITISLLFFVSHCFQLRPFSYAGIAVMLASLLFCNTNQLVSVYAFLLPNIYLIKIPGNGAALVGYWMVLIALSAVLLRHQRTVYGGVFICLLIHLICILLSTFITGNTDFYSSLVRLFSMSFLAMCLISSKDFSYEDLAEPFVHGCVVSVILSFAYNALLDGNIFGGYFSAINNDRNYFAVVTAFAIAVLLAYMYKHRQISILFSIELLILLASGILSNSRTFVILLSFSILLSVAIIAHLRGRKKILFIFAIIAIVLLSWLLLSDSIALQLSRFNKDDIYTANGRFTVWKYYLDAVFSSGVTALFGCGNSLDQIALTHITVVEHNTIVQALFTLGILGSASLVFVFFELYRLFSKIRRTESINPILFLPLLCILAGYCTINGLYSDTLMFSVILGFSIICLPNKGNLT
ncbi:MAG: O-antigen ligase family protein [Ruminiclostridium sp.]|nr:O-antigen ligase family protein [Ruminiclostridium sp.]